MSPMQLYRAPPPSYSEVTKNQPAPHQQQEGQPNAGMVPDSEATLQGVTLSEAPPAYESIQTPSLD